MLVDNVAETDHGYNINNTHWDRQSKILQSLYTDRRTWYAFRWLYDVTSSWVWSYARPLARMAWTRAVPSWAGLGLTVTPAYTHISTIFNWTCHMLKAVPNDLLLPEKTFSFALCPFPCMQFFKCIFSCWINNRNPDSPFKISSITHRLRLCYNCF